MVTAFFNEKNLIYSIYERKKDTHMHAVTLVDYRFTETVDDTNLSPLHLSVIQNLSFIFRPNLA